MGITGEFGGKNAPDLDHFCAKYARKEVKCGQENSTCLLFMLFHEEMSSDISDK